MIVVSASLWLALDPFEFGPNPIPYEMRRGGEQFVLGKGIERCWMEDRKEIGFWFDGIRKRGVEEAIWVSPNLASRWLGYMAAREKWTREEIDRGWSTIQNRMQGRIVWLVRLASYPKRDPLSPDDELGPIREDFDSVRFMATLQPESVPSRAKRRMFDLVAPVKAKLPNASPPKWLPVESGKIGQFRGRTLSSAEPPFWTYHLPWASAFGLVGPPNLHWSVGLFGDYQAAYYWVECTIPKERMRGSSMMLAVVAPHKERIAVFNLLPGRAKVD